MEWPDGRLGVDQDPPASIQMEEAAGGFSGDQPQGEQEGASFIDTQTAATL